MHKHIHHIAERFPESVDVVRELRAHNPSFASVCEEYEEVVGKLQRSKGKRPSPASVEWFRRRRLELEEELLTEIEGYRPL